jgi:ribosome-associated protein
MPIEIPQYQIAIPDDELVITFVRSSGPGGQKVNKTATKAQLRWNVQASPGIPLAIRNRFLLAFKARITQGGEIILTSQRHREAPKNATDCLTRLEAMLLSVARPPKKRKKTYPSRGSKERRLASKQRQSQKKQNRRTNWSD